MGGHSIAIVIHQGTAEAPAWKHLELTSFRAIVSMSAVYALVPTRHPGRHDTANWSRLSAGTCVNWLKAAWTRNEMTAHVVRMPGAADDLKGIVIGYSSLSNDVLVRYAPPLGTLLREAPGRR